MNPLLQIERQVLAEGQEWMRRLLEKRLQEACIAMEAVWPPTGEDLEDTRWRSMQLDTVVGRVDLKARHGNAPDSGWVCPIRQAWGLKPYERKTPELQARLMYTATVVGSYEGAEKMAAKWGTPVSDGCIHHYVQKLGRKAQELDRPAPPPASLEAAFDLVIMMDGWMARERGPDWGTSSRRKNTERVNWWEIKSAVIYRLDHRAQNESGRGILAQKAVVASPPETSPLDFGKAVQEEAMRRGLARARKVYVVIDGALWLWDLVEDRFNEAVKTLDFHHAREHLQVIAEALHGVGTSETQKWLSQRLHELRHGNEARVVNGLEQLIKLKRSAKSQKTLVREVKYFRRHRDHIHYQDREKEGAPMGSGAVESLGKQLQQRLRGCGQFWKRPGLTHLLELTVMAKNESLNLLWN